MLSEEDLVPGMDLPRKSEGEQRAFFDDVLARAREAEDLLGLVEVDIALAGTVVRLCFAGSEVAGALLPPVAHLRIRPSNRPDVRFHVWESGGSGLPMVQAPCLPTCFTHRGDIWTMMSRRVRSSYHSEEFTLNLLDLDRREGIFWVRSLTLLPYWAKAAPFRPLFHWWLEENGAQMLHAAAVGTPDGGVLITGKGGVGKSTTALNCLRAGLDYAGDDYVAVTLDPEPVAHSLYRTAKVDRVSMADFADLEPSLYTDDPADKAVILLDIANPALVRSIPLNAILTPEFAAEDQTSVAMCGIDRMRSAAAITTISQLPHAGEQTIGFVGRLLDRLPARLLRLGADRGDVPAALSKFLAGSLPESEHAAPVHDPGTPRISVIIPVFNGARFLADAVQSVLAQHHRALEIIVVDDGSLDDIDAAVAALPVPVRYFRQPNRGPSAARNKGISHATGDFLTFIDVDDLWPAGRLEASLSAFAARPELDVATGFCQLTEFDEASDCWIFVDDARRGSRHSIAAGLYRPRAFEKVGLFDEELRLAEDMDWFIRAREAGLAIEWLDMATSIVRRHTQNTTFRRRPSEMSPLLLFKNMLDRHRMRPEEGPAKGSIDTPARDAGRDAVRP
jgi:GT2 family glycosyltransferase